MKELAANNPAAAKHIKARGHVPKDTDPLPKWAELYTRAWSVLEHDRSLGHAGAMTRIHYASISRYAEDLGLSGDERRLMVFFVQQLDDEYLDFSRERLKEASRTK